MRLVILAALVVGASHARAGALEQFGFGGVASAMGGAQAGGVNDFGAVFYNPGALVGGHSVNLGLGWSYSIPSVYAENDFGPIAGLAQPPNVGGFHLGFVFPLGGKVEDRVAVGVGLFLPSQNLLLTQSLDEKTPQFYMFTSNTDKLAILVGVAVQVLPELSFGAGVNALAAMGGAVNFQMDLFGKNFERRDLSIELTNAIGPTAGVRWAATEEVSVGLSYRGALDLKYALPTTIDLGRDVGALALGISGVAHYTPHTVALGAAWRIKGLAVQAELGWQAWSGAPRDQVQVRVDLSGAVVDGLGLGGALDMDTSADPGMNFQDVLVPRLGVEWQAMEWLALRGGYSFRPSPVPDQRYRTNYLDNHTHGITAGLGFSFEDPLEVFAAPVHIDTWAQANVLEQRAALKEKNLHDPLGDYRYGGVVWQMGLGLRYTLK